jgi:hypothetical protein
LSFGVERLQTGRAKALVVKGKAGSISMSKSAQKVSSDRAKCDGPIEGFVAFAKRLTTPNAAQRLRRLADGPDADRFAERLVREAFGGSTHAATCLGLIGRLGSDRDWAARLQTVEPAGEPPVPDGLQTKELATVGSGLLVISREKALRWLARAYLRLKTASVARTAVQTLLLDAAPTTHALAAALSDTLGTLESTGLGFTKGLAKQCADTLEQHAKRHADANPEAAQSPLARLAKLADRADSARLVSALLSAGPPPADGGGNGSAEWSEADEALGRALQDMDFLDRSFAKLKSSTEGEFADRARRAKDASDLVMQWVRQAARYRSVAALNKVGDHVPFDPAKHEFDGDAQIGSVVRVVRPAVVRGSEPQQVVLVRGEAEEVE